jgi:hypothetical protein
MTWIPKHPSLWAGAIGGVLCLQIAVAQSVEELYEAGEQRIQQAQAQQDEIDAIVEVTEDRFEEYQVLLREIEDLRIYNNVLQAQVDAQNRDLNQLYASIDEVGVIERQILPLMRRMINGLERFISLDMPFALDERYERVERLRDLLLRSDVTVAEQFRLVLEAWLVEMNDFGRVGDTYIDEIVAADGVRRQVSLLRIGRVALLYVTPDGTRAGAWDQRTREWVELDPSYVREFLIGIDSYETEEAPSTLFDVPVAPPEED